MFTSDEGLESIDTSQPVSYTDRKKTQKIVKKIPPSALKQAKGMLESCNKYEYASQKKNAGIAIFTVFRTGLGWSGAGGSGVVLARLPDGSWSPPSGILLHTIGVGFLIGIDVYDVVLILRTQRAVDSFTSPKLSLGAELSIAAGPQGAGAMLETGIEASPAWSYTKSKGFYAGIQLDGNIIVERKDENARFYNRPGIKAKDILYGGAFHPKSCENLIRIIEKASEEPRRPTLYQLTPEYPMAGSIQAITPVSQEPMPEMRSHEFQASLSGTPSPDYKEQPVSDLATHQV